MKILGALRQKIRETFYPTPTIEFASLDHSQVHPTTVIIYGDSNFFYQGTRSSQRHIPFKKWPSTAYHIKEQLPEVQVIPASRLTFDSVDDWTESLMWKNLVAALPGKVVIIFWLGQNDCDNFSKALGTRPEQSKIDYYKGKMTRMLDRKEAYFQEAVKHGKAKTYWISPSDESGYEFTPQYIQMVSMLRNEIEGRKNLSSGSWIKI